MRQTAAPTATVNIEHMSEVADAVLTRRKCYTAEEIAAFRREYEDALKRDYDKAVAADDRPLKPGDIVRLKSGGPAMTVDRMTNHRVASAFCQWFIGGGELRQDVFSIFELERCPPDVFLGTTDILEIAPGDILVARALKGQRDRMTVLLAQNLAHAGILPSTGLVVLEPGESLSVIRKAEGA